MYHKNLDSLFLKFRLDYAFLTTTESDDVSPLGYDFSGEVSTEEQIYFAGYPADTEGGSKLIWSSGTRSPDVNALIHVPQNPLTQGSSGGAWLTLDSEGIYKIVGVASHGKPARGIPGAFSPLLSSDTAELLSSAESAVLSESAEHTVSIDEDETLIARSSNTQG